MKKMYVGNLPYSFSQTDLTALFQPFGQVSMATIMVDRETGQSRGFGFVEMEQDEAAAKAIAALDGTLVNGRALRVNEAREREPRRGGAGPGSRPAPRGPSPAAQSGVSSGGNPAGRKGDWHHNRDRDRSDRGFGPIKGKDKESKGSRKPEWDDDDEY
jgi:RNA recognition motif-containing protein